MFRFLLIILLLVGTSVTMLHNFYHDREVTAKVMEDGKEMSDNSFEEEEYKSLKDFRTALPVAPANHWLFYSAHTLSQYIFYCPAGINEKPFNPPKTLLS